MPMNNLNIYIACHKQIKIPVNNSLYIPLQVGKPHTKQQTSYISDDTSNNISEKNPVYSELTGWYWIWKNQKHDIIGTSHYRRYFTAKERSLTHQLKSAFYFAANLYKKRYGLYYTKDVDKWKNFILNSEEATEILKNHDIILPQRKIFKYSVKEQYAKRHRIEDLELVRQIIKELQSDYLNSFDKICSGNRLYAFNMFITSWKLFDEYMTWLFPLLFELEKRSDFSKDDPYQKRLCAFMGERLQNVWLHKKQLKIKELPVIYFKKTKEEHF